MPAQVVETEEGSSTSVSPRVSEGLSHSKEVVTGLSHVQEETVESLVAA